MAINFARRLMVSIVILSAALPMRAQGVPTSRQIPFNNVRTTITPGTTGQTLTIQLWDAATGGSLVFSETQTLDVDANGNISFVFGSATTGGLDPNNFPSGSTRFVDVVDSTNTSVLPSPPGRIGQNAVAFALSPGPQGQPGPPGPPGVVQSVSPRDSSIVVGGTAANLTVAVAPNGITNTHIANGALSPAKITGTAATLGSNSFVGNQAVGGDVSITGNLAMVDSTATAGNILKGGVLFIHNIGGNTALGRSALSSNTSGNFNTAVGFNALQSNTTGYFNTASGDSALQNNTVGISNTAHGANALLNNTAGGANTAIGSSALKNNISGDANTAIGQGVMENNTSGARNTAIGVGALHDNTSGNNNIAEGYGALGSNTTGINNTASGSNALASNLTGSYNTAFGDHALFSNLGNYNTAIGVNALYFNSSGSFNTAIGFGADTTISGDTVNATAIGYNALADASNKIRLGNFDVTVIEGQVPYTFTSDRNQKEDFQPVDGEQVLSKIGGLNLTSWNYIGHDPRKFRHYGPVAQEFFAAFGHDGVGTIGSPTTINSGDMEGILMIAVQALKKRNEQHNRQLEQQLDEQNKQLEQQSKELEQLQQRNKQLEFLRAENTALKAQAQTMLRRLAKTNLRTRQIRHRAISKPQERTATGCLP